MPADLKATTTSHVRASTIFFDVSVAPRTLLGVTKLPPADSKIVTQRKLLVARSALVG